MTLNPVKPGLLDGSKLIEFDIDDYGDTLRGALDLSQKESSLLERQLAATFSQNQPYEIDP